MQNAEWGKPDEGEEQARQSATLLGKCRSEAHGTMIRDGIIAPGAPSGTSGYADEQRFDASPRLQTSTALRPRSICIPVL